MSVNVRLIKIYQRYIQSFIFYTWSQGHFIVLTCTIFRSILATNFPEAILSICDWTLSCQQYFIFDFHGKVKLTPELRDFVLIFKIIFKCTLNVPIFNKESYISDFKINIHIMNDLNNLNYRGEFSIFCAKNVKYIVHFLSSHFFFL